MKHTDLVTATVVILLLFLSSCKSPQTGEPGVATPTGPQPTVGQGGRFYTAYNLWYEKPLNMYCINYNRGAMIPAGAEVSSVEIVPSRKKPAIQFINTENESTHVIYFMAKFHPGVTIEEFKDRLFTTKPFAELAEGLTNTEVESVRDGRLTTGMSKRAVVMSRGYPPEHQTPSLERNSWYYWPNRFRKMEVRFDGNGQTSVVPAGG